MTAMLRSGQNLQMGLRTPLTLKKRGTAHSTPRTHSEYTSGFPDFDAAAFHNLNSNSSSVSELVGRLGQLNALKRWITLGSGVMNARNQFV
jgi:hypothetical protein